MSSGNGTQAREAALRSAGACRAKMRMAGRGSLNRRGEQPCHAAMQGGCPGPWPHLHRLAAAEAQVCMQVDGQRLRGQLAVLRVEGQHHLHDWGGCSEGLGNDAGE